MPDRRFFPLDRKLKLRPDRWSEGAGRVATRLGLTAPSFDLAAETYEEAVGAAMSADSLRRVTQNWGRTVEDRRQHEAQRANAPTEVGESPRERRLAEIEPIRGQANISTDGTMVLIREEGWKEVKLTALSQVHVKPAAERPIAASGSSRRSQDPWVELSQHSYQAGLWDADTLGEHQYAEGLRRGLDHCQRLSSVNDAAEWVERITDTNFPDAQQIVDWSHASQRLWTVAKEVWGAPAAQSQPWAEAQLDHLWDGQVAEVIRALDQLDLEAKPCSNEVRQAPGYFRTHQPRMRYDEFRRQGYPIGSGTVESAANTVVQHRLQRPGRGWKRVNGQAMLAGLSELHSRRFDRAWRASQSCLT